MASSPAELASENLPPLTADPMAGGALRVLHVEDDRIHAETVRVAIAADFPGSLHQVVSNRVAYVDALSPPGFDLIVSDFSLDAFNGLDALDLARHHAPHLPFVFYSSTIGEDRAVQALRHGAFDYVPKGRIDELRSAIRRAVAEHSDFSKRVSAPKVAPFLSPEVLENAAHRVTSGADRIEGLENDSLLTAGAAHDLNNMLTPLLMAVPMMRETLHDTGGRRFLDALEKSTLRASKLVQQLLAFAHDGDGEPEEISSAELMRDIVKFMETTFPHNVRIAAVIEPTLWPLRAVRTQVYQAILNLCVNARNAMPKGGLLTAIAVNRVLDERQARAMHQARPGKFVSIQIEDSGASHAPSNLSRLWDIPEKNRPAETEGLIGLPTVKNIIRDHGGFVSAASLPGLGSSFAVFLPAIR